VNVGGIDGGDHAKQHESDAHEGACAEPPPPRRPF
jgi:hypothetical protein